MAINPNTDFTSGAVLTAAQQNRFPRGIMSYASVTTSDTTITAEETQITGTAFTAVANRYYRVTYYEPDLYNGTTYMYGKIKNGATVLNTAYHTVGAGNERQLITMYVGTFTAGSVTLTATLQSASGTGQAIRSANVFAFLLVEDMGPA
jgi:hypothetical protein